MVVNLYGKKKTFMLLGGFYFFPLVWSGHVQIVNLQTVTTIQDTLQIHVSLILAYHFLTTDGAIKHVTFC